MRRMCFDGSGQLYDQVQLEYQSGSALTGDAFATYAACNLGYVSGASNSSHLRLWLRPSHVSDHALTETIYYLAQTCPGRVILNTFEQDWKTAIVPLGYAIDRLSEYSCLRKNLSDYQRREITALPPQLQGLVDLWKSLSGSYQPEPYLKLAAATLNDRLFVVAPRSDYLCYQHFGGGIAQRTFAREVREGAPIKTLSDTAYALRTELSYHQALEKAGRPTLEKISARVRPHQFPEARIEYTRLLLPCETSRGSPRLVGTSVMNAMVH